MKPRAPLLPPPFSKKNSYSQTQGEGGVINFILPQPFYLSFSKIRETLQINNFQKYLDKVSSAAIIINMKVCTKCKEAFPSSEFRKQSSTKDGLKYYCKKCDNELAKSYYKKNKNKIVDKVKEWQKDNPEKVKGYKKSYYGKNRTARAD